MRLFHLSTEFTKKEKKKQKEKEMTAATNLNSYKFCVDKREQFRFYRSINRRVLGCMNDHIKSIDFMLSFEREKYIKDDFKINLHAIGSQLNRTPMVSYLNGFPIDALRDYVDG